MIKLHLITRVSKTVLFDILISDITNFKYEYEGLSIRRHLLIDASSYASPQTQQLLNLQSDFIFVKLIQKKESDIYLHQALSEYCKTYLSDGWVYILDDDNRIHENLFRVLLSKTFDHLKMIHVGHQDIDYKDFTVKKIREANAESMKRSGVDSAQVILHHSLFKDYSISENYTGDSEFIELLFLNLEKYFQFHNAIIAYYNFYSVKPNKFLPTILYIGNDLSLLKTNELFDYNEKYFNTLYKQDDSQLKYLQSQYDIDLYVSETSLRDKLEILNAEPIYVRRKWIEVDEHDVNKGNTIYSTYISSILQNYDKKHLISFFTSTYNTGKEILKVYHTLKNQIYTNWEWIIVDDSTDDNATYKLLINIAEADSRVQVYSFNKKTGGIVGEAKYRAACLCSGDILVELDHDDYLTDNCALLVWQAYQKYPDAGFFYSDSVEIEKNFASRGYGDHWAFGYGGYRDEVINIFGNRQFKVPITPNVNPKTIRHIVGVPNHLRAWKRDFYFSIGGHNRRLPVVDDYELIVRTFLNTTMVHIEHTCYIQVFGGTNYQDRCRPEISRRVDAVRRYYNNAIKNRFEFFGIEDWCDTEYKFLTVPPKFGDQEGKVNLTFKLE